MASDDDLGAALDRADELITKMADYIGKMALPAEFFANLNEHWMLMERRRRAARQMEAEHG